MEALEALASPYTYLLAVIALGFMPGFVLRIVVRLYPKGHVRRLELLGEMYGLRRLERPFFVAEQFETALFEGLPLRVEGLRQAVGDRWRLKLAAWLRARSRSDPEALGRKVFVVHGRDQDPRSTIFDFLRGVGLHPMEWVDLVHMTGFNVPTIREVMDRAVESATATIVLLSSDEYRMWQANPQESDQPTDDAVEPRARTNVLFEAGWALARFPERVILLDVSVLHPVTDLGAGLNMIRFDGSAAARRKLVSRLEAAGCTVNAWDGLGDDWRARAARRTTISRACRGLGCRIKKVLKLSLRRRRI